MSREALGYGAAMGNETRIPGEVAAVIGVYVYASRDGRVFSIGVSSAS